MIAILDYDAGNIKSVEKAFSYLGEPTVLTTDPRIIQQADGVVLPGVGAFGQAMENIKKTGLDQTIPAFLESKKPFLGICLGLQLLFEQSEESPDCRGLGILPGKIVRIPEGEGLKIPHMGWNQLEITEGSRLFQGIGQDSFVYFVHSYYLQATQPDLVAARTQYGVSMDVAVEQDHIFAVQFHPEKSGRLGLQILQNFIQLTKEGNSNAR